MAGLIPKSARRTGHAADASRGEARILDERHANGVRCGGRLLEYLESGCDLDYSLAACLIRPPGGTPGGRARRAAGMLARRWPRCVLALAETSSTSEGRGRLAEMPPLLSGRGLGS